MVSALICKVHGSSEDHSADPTLSFFTAVVCYRSVLLTPSLLYGVESEVGGTEEKWTYSSIVPGHVFRIKIRVGTVTGF